MQLIDSHAHIDFPQFADDRDAMFDRARAAGVEHILAIGTGPGPEKLDAAIEFAEQIRLDLRQHRHPPARGERGHAATSRQLAELAKHPKVIAWGEIGLDYFYDHSPARRAGPRLPRSDGARAPGKLPIIIHCRDAWADTLNVLEEAWKPDRPRRHPPLLHQHARRRPARPRHGLPDFVCGQFNLSESGKHSRRCESFAAGENSDRNGLSVPCAATLSRQAQRTCLCCRSSEGDCDL